MNQIHLFNQITIFFTFLLCFSHHYTYVTTNRLPQKKVIVTIFVHGIMSIRPHLGIKNFMRFMTDSIHDTLYERAISEVRNTPFFYNGQTMQQVGLQPIILSHENKASTEIIATLLETVTTSLQKKNKTINHYYTYGWPAYLSKRARQKAAHELYYALVALKKKYLARGYKIHIRIIGYSHGANVVMALGSLPKSAASLLVVNEAITLGMPVNYDEHQWIHHPIFEKVYHLFSRSDNVQKIDIFTRPGNHSFKKFFHQKNLALPSKLRQIEIRSMRKTKKALSTNTPDSEYIFAKKKWLRDDSPGHIELWFFGWAAELHQKNLCLKPLPYLIFTPLFLKEADLYAPENRAVPLIIDLRPENNMMLTRHSYTQYPIHINPFVPLSTLEEFKKIASDAQPAHYNERIYKEKVATIIESISILM